MVERQPSERPVQRGIQDGAPGPQRPQVRDPTQRQQESHRRN